VKSNNSESVLLPTTHHWSASRFMLFEQCPRAFEDRYINGLASEPSLAMLFGHSVHTALEALHQGHRGVCRNGCADGHLASGASLANARLEEARSRYFREFDSMRARLAEVDVTVDGTLYLEGLRMIDQVNYLGLNRDGESRSERRITIPTSWGGLDWPVVGAVDLWSPPWSQHGAVVWDFKTTVGSWSETRAGKETWQPLLYSWAYVRAYDVIPTFRYLVLSRTTGELNTFDRRWRSRREFDRDLESLSFAAEEIAEAVAEGRYDCTRGHGTCLECGAPFGHGHVCATPKRSTVKLTGAGKAPSYASG